MRFLSKINRYLQEEEAITNAELRAAGTPIPKGFYGWDLPDSQKWAKKKIIGLVTFAAQFIDGPKANQAKVAFQKELKTMIDKMKKKNKTEDLSKISWVSKNDLGTGNWKKDFMIFCDDVGKKIAGQLAKSVNIKLKDDDLYWLGSQFAWKYGKQIHGIDTILPSRWEGTTHFFRPRSGLY